MLNWKLSKINLLFTIAAIGIFVGFVSAYFYSAKAKPKPPFSVNSNPYSNGIYASGIIESFQEYGSNINIYPEVAGKVVKITVSEGQRVKRGTPILFIDDTIQKAIVAKDSAQVRASYTLLEELKARPRKEDLDVAIAQLLNAQATLKNARDQLDKIRRAHSLNPHSISKNTLDNAINAELIAKSNLQIAQKQHDLVKAGAWIYDIKNQENQLEAAVQNYNADKELLHKYTITAPADGTIMRIVPAIGSYISQQGVYEPYANNMSPIIIMGATEPYLAVRCYVEEMLVQQLPDTKILNAVLLIRGKSNYSIPLEFVKIQPYTIPNIELSYQKAAKVDIRVLPIVFKFKIPPKIKLYPGQLVDVYIQGKQERDEEEKNDKKDK